MLRITFSFFLCLLLACSLTLTNAAALEPPKEFKEGQTGSIQTTTSISQHGITWSFANPVQYGQFVNGDYWVVDLGGGVKITRITPGYTNSPREKNGSMINPSTAPQGYDGSRDYSNSVNVGIGISESTPLNLTENQSLVSTISVDTVANSNASYVKTAAVLTCLSATPSAGSFRPGISGTTKTIYNKSNLNLSLLKKLAVPSGQTVTATTLSNYSNYFKMVWLDHYHVYTARNMHPVDSGLDNYYFPIKWAEAALMLHLNFTDAEKEELLTHYIQLGIDLYSYVNSGGKGWEPNGGHSSGRKWPILFAGLMLNDANMKGIGAKSGDYLYSSGFGPGNPPPDYKHFGEDGQTFYVTQSDIKETTAIWIKDFQRVSGQYLSYNPSTEIFTIGTPGSNPVGPWEPDTRNTDSNGNVACRPYTTSLLGMPEWGIRHSIDPKASDSSWTASYRSAGSGVPSWAGFTLAAHMMSSKSLWNNNALFDYVDRYVAISKGNADPTGFTVNNQLPGDGPVGLVLEMYDTYRSLF